MIPPHHKPLRIVHLLIALALFGGLVVLSYPYYRYFVDPDAVAYLTMAKRAAGGEPWRLVNALWSPLHPAIVSLCIGGGMDALLAAQLTNAVACALILAASFSLFRQFRVARDIGIALLTSLSIFLTYALYKQLFCDLWQVAFLLGYLLFITAADFLKKPLYWCLCAVIMTLAVYAKVYSFYFLLLHLPLSLWLSGRASGKHFPLKPYISTLALHLLLLVPLVVLMHQKYGFWGLSKSGAMNTSWTLTGHKTLKPEIHTLIPPPYANSPYTWEDPYLSEGALHGRFEGLAMMKSQIGHSILAALQGVEAAGQISPFLLIALLGSAVIALQRRRPDVRDGHKILLLAAGIMPIGYLLLHFEARYIWLLLPVAMIFGACWLERVRPWLAARRAFVPACWIFALSFIVYPLHDMKALFRKGEDTYNLAAKLTSLNMRGSFTSNDNPSRAGCLAYWMGCNYYTPVGEVVKTEDVLADMRRYNVTFYFHHQNGLDAASAWMPDEQGKPFQRLDGGRIRGMQVFIVNP